MASIAIQWAAALLRHYPLQTPRVKLLRLLPATPEALPAFRVKGGLRISGYYPGHRDVVSKSLFWLGDFEPWVIALMQRVVRPGDIVLDIGANIGAMAIRLARLAGPQGKVICFEPCPPNLQKLRANIAANDLANVEVIEAAATSEPCRVTVAMADGQPGHASVQQDGAAGGYEVPGIPLDDFAAQRGLERVALCKIDVEGYEKQVLGGMKSLLARGAIDALVFERHLGSEWGGDEVVQLLQAAGYQVLRACKGLCRTTLCEPGHTPRGRATSDFLAVRKGSEAQARVAK